ncbi:unnamed protein product [Caenorhabditis nigoni]
MDKAVKNFPTIQEKRKSMEKLDNAVKVVIETFRKINMDVPPKFKESFGEIEKLNKQTDKKLSANQKLKVEFIANYEKLSPELKCKGYEAVKTSELEIVDLFTRRMVLYEELHKKLATAFADVLECYEKNKMTLGPIAESVRNSEITPSSATSSGNPEKGKRGRKKKVIKEIKQEPLDNDDGLGDVKEENEENEEEEEEQEKHYCWCQLEKEDQMVECENKRCPLEWFHFSCMEMVTAPVGDWYCSIECRNDDQDEKRKNGTKITPAEVGTMGGLGASSLTTTPSAKRGPKKRK